MREMIKINAKITIRRIYKTAKSYSQFLTVAYFSAFFRSKSNINFERKSPKMDATVNGQKSQYFAV